MIIDNIRGRRSTKLFTVEINVYVSAFSTAETADKTNMFILKIFSGKRDTSYSKPLLRRLLLPPRPEGFMFDIFAVQHFHLSQIPVLFRLFLALASRASDTVQSLPDDLNPICSAPCILFHATTLIYSFLVMYAFAILFVFAATDCSFVLKTVLCFKEIQ